MGGAEQWAGQAKGLSVPRLVSGNHGNPDQDNALNKDEGMKTYVGEH